jgi:hypothetical protein
MARIESDLAAIKAEVKVARLSDPIFESFPQFFPQRC